MLLTCHTYKLPAYKLCYDLYTSVLRVLLPIINTLNMTTK